MRVLVAIVVALALPSAAALAAPPYVIQGDRAVAGLGLYRTTPPDATARFGPARSPRPRGDGGCIGSWPRIGLVVAFFAFEGPPCRNGGALRFTVTSRSAWRTAFGLRVGDGLARLRALYPHARHV